MRISTTDKKVSDPTPAEPGLLRSTSVFALMTFISRVLGLLREWVIATLFGAVAGVDAFFIAFKIPNFMRRLFAEGAFSQAFIPVLAHYQQQQDKQAIKNFISYVAGTLGIALLIISLLAMTNTPFLVKIFAPGFELEGERFASAVSMLRVTFPYLLFISLAAFAGAVLNSYGRFALPAFAPALLNLTMILAAVYLAPHLANPVSALAWGVLLAGIVQLLLLMAALARQGLLVWPRWRWRDPGVKRVLKLMVPALFGVSVAQINLLIDTIFASFLPVGSVSWLYFSDRMMNFPLGVFGVAIATVVLPHLSRSHAKQSTQAYGNTLDWALRCILVIALPAAAGLWLLAGPMLASLLGYGKFTLHDVNMSRLSLLAFALGVPAFMLIKTLASAFYARQDIKTPVKIGALAMVVNVALNLALIKPLAHAGLALATSIAAYLNAGCLFVMLIRRQVWQPRPGGLWFVARLLIANAVMIAWLSWLGSDLDQWMAWRGQQRLLHLGGAVLSAMVIYLMALAAFGLRWKDFRHHP